jgi:Rv0078B-related antitoxin
MPISDTSPAMREAYYRRLAEMTPSERVRIMADLWETGHALQCAGVRQQFPEADENEVIFRVAVARFGEELARKVYGR